MYKPKLSITDRHEISTYNLKQKLLDNQITNMGMSTIATRLKVEENKYGDSEYKIILNDNIVVQIAYPGGVPMTRGRTDQFSSESSSQSVYLFDILPITIFTKFEDNVEKGDIIIHSFVNEKNIYTLFVLQITEIIGTFRATLLHKELKASPMNSLPKEVQTIVDNIDLELNNKKR